MKTMKKVALAVALTAMAGGAMADGTYMYGHNNVQKTNFEAVVNGGSCHVSLFGTQLLLGPSQSNKIAWSLVTFLCPGGQPTCVATINSYPNNASCANPTPIAQATLYMSAQSGHKVGDVVISGVTTGYHFTVTQASTPDNSPTIILDQEPSSTK